VLRHVNAGFTDNAMTVWKPENELTDEMLQVFKDEAAITHLYIRTIYPGVWEYPLFAMIHGRSTEELNAIINDLSKRSGISDFMSLRTLKEFKKERVTYLTDAFDKWRKEQ
jgi:DNA-binding Lrp family transcriptional regulator